MIIVFDTETTGLIPGDDEVIQFSAIDEDGKVLMNEYIKPSRHTSFPEASEVNGIYYEDLKDKPLFGQYRDQIQELFDQAGTLVTYNGEFDINMLKGEGIRFKKYYKHYDVMKLFAPIYGEYNKKHRSYKWQTLSTCANYYGYEFRAHDSLEDVRATLYCFKKIMEIKNAGK